VFLCSIPGKLQAEIAIMRKATRQEDIILIPSGLSKLRLGFTLA
jgi:hypothetical protein